MKDSECIGGSYQLSNLATPSSIRPPSRVARWSAILYTVRESKHSFVAAGNFSNAVRLWPIERSGSVQSLNWSPGI